MEDGGYDNDVARWVAGAGEGGPIHVHRLWLEVSL